MDIKSRIIQLCEERGITPNKLAELSDITQSTLNSIINNPDPNPQHKTIEKICRGLGITMSDFFMDNQVKQQIGADLFPKLLQVIQTMDLPQDIKTAALQKFNSLTDNQKKAILPQLVKSVNVAEDSIRYEVDGATKETIDKYKSLPDKHRKALEIIIDSLYKSH